MNIRYYHALHDGATRSEKNRTGAAVGRAIREVFFRQFPLLLGLFFWYKKKESLRRGGYFLQKTTRRCALSVKKNDTGGPVAKNAYTFAKRSKELAKKKKKEEKRQRKVQRSESETAADDAPASAATSAQAADSGPAAGTPPDMAEKTVS